MGFGVFMVENNGPCEEAVTKALAAGCRLLDTAAAYFNETDVGKQSKAAAFPVRRFCHFQTVAAGLWL